MCSVHACGGAHIIAVITEVQQANRTVDLACGRLDYYTQTAMASLKKNSVESEDDTGAKSVAGTQSVQKRGD